MQGRLSPVETRRFQFFPNDWLAEFTQAKEIGFDGICWFLDLDKPKFDPIKDIWGKSDVLAQIDEVIKIAPIRGVDTGRYSFFGPEARDTLKAFQILLPALVSRLAGGVVSIPLLEDKFPKSENEKRESVETLGQVANIAKSFNLRLALETEWSADQVFDFLNLLNCENVGVCYDIGNTTSYGFDCPAEIRQLGQKIFDVHLKDRKVGKTQSMLLGTGDADFPSCFQALEEIDYRGGFTMQAWRGEDYLVDAKKQSIFIKKCLNSL